MRFSEHELVRYSRQMLLSDVGGRGQERLRNASANAASELEALYLAAAGVGRLRVPDGLIAAAVQALNPLVTVEVDGSLPHAADDGPLKALQTLRQVIGP